MNDHLETWVSTVASHLDLPARQAAIVVEELRSHLEADLANRLRAGTPDSEATRATLAEVGDPGSVAAELNRVHSTEGSPLRTSLGVLTMLLGIVGIAAAMDSGLIRTLDRLAAVLGRGRWYDHTQIALRWILDSGLAERVLFPLLLLGLSFIVGYVARRQGWKCALYPIAGFYVLATLGALASGAVLRFSVSGTAEYATYALAVLAGAHLGSRLARSASPYRRTVFALLAAVAAWIPALGWIDLALILSPASTPSLFGILILVAIAVVTVLALVLLARRMHRAGT
jgi:hypothetical protein